MGFVPAKRIRPSLPPIIALVCNHIQRAGIRASGYAPNLNVTIAISGSGGPSPGFPLNQLADSNGDLSYVWPSIPASISLGNYTLTLTGSPTKTPPDIQSFTVTATNVTISPLTIS